MKKIMFSDSVGLTQAVLERRKTMTRRFIHHPDSYKGYDDIELTFCCCQGQSSRAFACSICDSTGNELGEYPLPYEVGQELAVAQSYETIYKSLATIAEKDEFEMDLQCAYNNQYPQTLPGWSNKMFVRADLMPHRIRIKSMWYERLMGICDKDCFKEGITTKSNGKYGVGNGYNWEPHKDSLDKPVFFTPRAAFAALIDRVAGKGTWLSNPWMIVYEFELIK